MKKQIQIITGTEIDVVEDMVNNFLDELSKRDSVIHTERTKISFRTERINSQIDSYSMLQYIFVIEYIEE